MLSGKEKSKFRAEANHLKPEINIGKEGVAEGVINNLLNAFRTKEIVKVKLLEKCPLDVNAVSEKLIAGVECELVQKIGRTLVFYKELEEDE
ncbi:MAG: YhbY family RNA-binding protein [Calditrichia bacterium]|nr:YhbY family RNA-binding protein [Calditrichia bacterium]